MPQFPVQIKRSGTASSAPTSLLHGELAINYNVADGKLFWKDSSNTIRSFAFASYLPTSGGTISGSLTVNGDLTVLGDTVTLTTSTVVVEDKNIELGSVYSPTDETADGGGITLLASSPKSIIWYNATDSWTFNQNVELTSGFSYRINGASVLNATTLGSGVTSSSLTSVGTVTTGVWSATAIGPTKGGTGLTSVPQGSVLVANAANTITALDGGGAADAFLTYTASTDSVGWSTTFPSSSLPLATTSTAGVVIVGTGLSVSSGTVSVAYGSNSTSACRGDDSRLSDSRAPSGAAGGDLTGTYPNPQIAAGAIVTADLANSAVTYAKVQNVSATDRLLGRSSAGAGVIEEVTCTSQGRSLIAGVDAAAQRTTLGLGAMATSSGITLTGDVTGSGTGSFATTLSNSGVSAGTYRSVTVDVKGRVTGGTNPTTLAGYGITDAPTTTGTGASGTWAISISGSAAQLGGVAAANYFRVDGSYPNADMNVPVEGYWHVASNAANLPDGGLYGHRWDYDHAGDGNWVAQFYTPTSGDAGMWFRQRRGGTWQTWRKLIDSTTYNSYSPTLTGGGASGTWGINVTGTAASETLATVTGRGASTSTNILTTGAMFASNWFRSYGATGWYNEAYGGGIWMADATYVRVYGGKQFYADAAISSATAMYAPIYYDANDGAYWVDPANAGFNLRGGASNRVTYATTDSGIMVSNAEGAGGTVRLGAAWGRTGIYNNPNITIGSESQIDFVTGNVVRAYIDSSANLFANGSVRAPIFYDSQNTAFYCDPNGTSRMSGMNIDSVVVLGADLYVGGIGIGGTTYSTISMNDADEGARLIHCNSNRIGFLNQGGGWGSWCNDDGSWQSDFPVYATAFHETGFGGRIFGAKAWCNHNGSTSPAAFADGSGNISTIGYRSATGRYRANFTTGITPYNAAFIGTAYGGGDSASATMVRFSTRNVVNSRTTYIDYAVSVGGAYSGALDVMFVVVG